MADNSKREQIIQYWVDKFEADDTVAKRRFAKVQRLMPKFADMGSIAETMLPLLAIVAKLPKPVEHKKSRAPGGTGDYFISALEVEFIVYFMDNEEPDKMISDLADDIWATLYGDTTSGSKPDDLTLGLTVMPEPVIGMWDPYVVFKMVCSFSYYHTTGGI